jgi:hypothetical protein
VLRIGRLVQQFRTQPVSRAAAFHFESELQRLLIEVGRRIVQWTYNHLESTDRSRLPPDLFWHNDHYRLITTLAVAELDLPVREDSRLALDV